MKRTTKLIGVILVTVVAVTAVYIKGIYDGGGGKELALTEQAVAAQAKSTASPVTAVKERAGPFRHSPVRVLADPGTGSPRHDTYPVLDRQPA